MKRVLTIFLLSLSISILLLHSFVPHHHDQHAGNYFDLQATLQEEPVNSPIDLLKVGFHINLGAGHLENYKQSKSQFPIGYNDTIVVDKVLSAQAFFFDLLPLNIIVEFPSTQTPSFNNLFLLRAFSYRGPPMFI
ncbi:hypothetical protein JKA74_20255 [Marivirga sp. S37H4]|uniref:Uncharacterized protein n=1 Tax=Marivirga aurantiaca TaxID=2802615 RepID=A0A935CCB2_9BACT|nr:hypothetical protein [Marivirga aurantiaca]MBK6267387.1 hypothetical protein [Marivirga aurantiaca]